MTELILIRGLPGSGKSTLARKLQDEMPASGRPLHWEADMFFMGENGVYKYRRELIDYAHKWCIGKTAFSLNKGYSVIVSNTFCAMWEMEEYFLLASRLEVPVFIHELHTQYGSIHGVPEEAVVRMKARWEKLPDYYEVTCHS